MLRVAAIVVLVGCGHSRDDTPIPPTKPIVELAPVPSVTGQHAEDSAQIVVTPTKIAVDGVTRVELHDGVVAPTDIEGGATGIRIPKLTVAASALPGDHGKPLHIALDRHTPYRTLAQILVSTKHVSAGFKTFALLARAGETTVAIPLALPEMSPASAASATPSDLPAARIKLAPATADPMVQNKIAQVYVPGIRRCYQQLLATSPDANGKLTITLALDDTGKVSKPEVAGIDAHLDACVANVMTAWRFPAPKSPDRPRSTVTFKLVPETATKPPAAGAQDRDPPIELSPPDEPLKLIVSVTQHELLLWSMSGQEGTLAKPKLRLARTDADANAKLGAALGEIVQRRFSQARQETPREIIFMADGGIPVDVVLPVIVTMRTAPDGAPRFPDVLLSMGFQ